MGLSAASCALLQAKVSEELKPLTVVVAEIEKKLTGGEQIPDFGTLTAWAESEARRSAGAGAPRDAQAAAEPLISLALDGKLSASLLVLVNAYGSGISKRVFGSLCRAGSSSC